jgi:hypothetical protein
MILLSSAADAGATGGIGLGSVLAVVCSWERNRSIGWAILAALFNWFYVIYFAITRREDEVK